MKTWVVGGTSGIGERIAKMLHPREEGHAGDEAFVSGRFTEVRFDLALRQYVDANGPFDSLVYCAGVNHLDWSSAIDPIAMSMLYEINVVGLIRALQAAGGVRRVVVVGSDAAWRPMRTSVAYCASKAALHMAVQVIARERGGEDTPAARRRGRPDPFAICCVAPGKVADTPMTDYVDRRSAELRPEIDHIAYQQSQIPGGDFLSKSDVAEVVVWALRAPASINGSIIPVNGGRS